MRDHTGWPPRRTCAPKTSRRGCSASRWSSGCATCRAACSSARPRALRTSAIQRDVSDSIASVPPQVFRLRSRSRSTTSFGTDSGSRNRRCRTSSGARWRMSRPMRADSMCASTMVRHSTPAASWWRRESASSPNGPSSSPICRRRQSPIRSIRLISAGSGVKKWRWSAPARARSNRPRCCTRAAPQSRCSRGLRVCSCSPAGTAPAGAPSSAGC